YETDDRERVMLKRLSWMLACLTLAGCTEPTSIIIQPLRVLYWSPGGAYCVDVTTKVSATFSADLIQDSVTAESFFLRGDGGPVAGNLEYDEATFSVHLTPDAPLAFDQQYTAVATKEIESKSMGRLAIDLEASFVTVSRTGCKPPIDCEPPDCCTLSSQCPGVQICLNGTCTDECLTDRDCFRGRCVGGGCVPEIDGGGGDPASGDPAVGDPVIGDPTSGDPGVGDDT
ncbi:Ig-like domain-containing protein, partial [Myxococcota bacterium]